MDQRKVNMLAREYCNDIKRKLKPVILSHRMMPGLLEVRPLPLAGPAASVQSLPVTTQSPTGHHPATHQSPTSHHPATQQSPPSHRPVTHQSPISHIPVTHQSAPLSHCTPGLQSLQLATKSYFIIAGVVSYTGCWRNQPH